MAQASDETIVRYLLGRLSETECSDLEDRYFPDDLLYEQFLAIEEELIDAYVNGDLTDADRAAFESRLLTSSELKQRIAFARALAVSNRRFSERQPWKAAVSRWMPTLTSFRFACVSLAACLIVGLIIWSPFWRRPFKSVPPVVSGLEHPNPSSQAVPGRSVSPPPAPDHVAVIPAPPIAVFVLTPTIRGASRTIISIPPGADRIRLDLRLDSLDFSRYEAVLESQDGSEILRGQAPAHERIAPSTESASFTVASKFLRTGNYVVKLSGIAADGNAETVAGYTFGVQ